MLTILMFAAGLVLLLAPDTPIGRQLKRVLVEWPAERLSRVRPGLVLLILLLVVAGAALIAVAKSEGAFLVAQGLPEALASLAAFDVATYLDVLAIAWLFAASVRLRAVKAAIGSAMARARPWIARQAAPRARARRSRPASPPPANSDDEGSPGFALAA
ncbi:MAG: hypothetical protein JWP50_1295 [Phenylobacterium sp.]|nr:hypothetical protein [Phenylobacterium sp.]